MPHTLTRRSDWMSNVEACRTSCCFVLRWRSRQPVVAISSEDRPDTNSAAFWPPASANTTPVTTGLQHRGHQNYYRWVHASQRGLCSSVDLSYNLRGQGHSGQAIKLEADRNSFSFSAQKMGYLVIFGFFPFRPKMNFHFCFISFSFQKCHLRWAENVMFATEP